MWDHVRSCEIMWGQGERENNVVSTYCQWVSEGGTKWESVIMRKKTNLVKVDDSYILDRPDQHVLLVQLGKKSQCTLSPNWTKEASKSFNTTTTFNREHFSVQQLELRHTYLSVNWFTYILLSIILEREWHLSVSCAQPRCRQISNNALTKRPADCMKACTRNDGVTSTCKTGKIKHICMCMHRYLCHIDHVWDESKSLQLQLRNVSLQQHVNLENETGHYDSEYSKLSECTCSCNAMQN